MKEVQFAVEKSLAKMFRKDGPTPYGGFVYFKDMQPMMTINEQKTRDTWFVVEDTFYSANVDSHTIIWGMVVLVCFHFGVELGYWPIIHERKVNLTHRLRVLGLRVWHFETVRWFDLLLIVVGTSYFIVLTQLLHRIYFPIGGVHLILFCFGCAGFTTGMVFALYCDTFAVVYRIMMMVNTIALLISGVMWPLESMTPLSYLLSQLVPHTHVVAGIHSYIFRNFGLAHFEVLKAVWVSLLWMIGAYAYYFLTVWFAWYK